LNENSYSGNGGNVELVGALGKRAVGCLQMPKQTLGYLKGQRLYPVGRYGV